MRIYLRLLVVLFLVLAASLAPVAISHHASGVALADNDKAKDESKGNDDHDDKGKAKDKKDKSGKSAVNPVAGYTVEVTCEIKDATTTCTFVPQAPEGGKKVDHLLIPAEAVCADVVDSDTEYVDPDPNVHRTGFRATGKKGATLTLVGEVATNGTTTYWVKAANGVYPATGPALACGPDTPASPPETTPPADGKATPTQAPAPTDTATPPATTGTILVTTYTCSGVTADTPDVDWYGACQLAGAGQTFAVTGGSTELTQTSGDDGTATFADLAPASYSLDDTSADWCHAESDSVDSSGQLVIEAGATAKVWLFYCS